MDLELEWNLFQIHAELRLAATAASLAVLLRLLHPAPSLEKKMVNELQMKPRAPTSNGMQWTFHPLDVHSHQSDRVIRRSSPPPAVSVPFTPRDSIGMGEGRDLAPGWTGYYLALVAGGGN